MENANLSTTTLKWLYDASRWARFIAILGFIMIGFLVIVGIFIGPALSILNEDIDIAGGNAVLSGGIIAAIYIVIAIIYFFPIYYLFQFSNGVTKAYKTKDEDSLNASFLFLKKHFKFIGVLLIIVLAIYILLFVVTIFGFVAGLF